MATSSADAVWIDVLPSLDKLVPSLRKGLANAMPAAGREAGAQYSQGFAQAAVSGVERASAQLAAARKKEADAAGQVRVAEAKLQELRDSGNAKTAQLVAAEERLAKAKRGLDAQTDAVAGATRRLSAAQDDGEKNTGRLSGALSGLGGKTAGVASKGMDSVKLAIAGVATGAAGAVAVVSNFWDTVSSGKANDKLAAQLGLDPAESAQAGKVAGALYRDAYGDSLAQVNDAVRAVTQNIGTDLNSADFQGITGKVLDLSTAFDQDLGGTTAAVGQLMKTGLARDAGEALDIITSGFQLGVDKSGDYLDTLNEYGTQFQKLGINGATATGLLSQGLKAGARDSDLVADAIKEFSIRAIDGSKTTGDAFTAIGLDAEDMSRRIAAGGPEASAALGQTLDALRSIEDPVARNAAAVGLFGTQAEDLGGALFALNPATATLDNVAGAAGRMGDTLNDNFATRLEGWKRNAMGFVQEGLLAIANGFSTGQSSSAGWQGGLEQAGIVVKDVFAFLRDTAVPALISVGGWVQQNTSWLLPLVGGLLAAVAAYKVITAVTEAFRLVQLGVNLVLAANPIALVVIAIAALVAGVIYAYTHFEWFRDAIGVVWDALKAAFGWVKDNWPLILAILTGPIGLAVLAIVKNWDTITAAFHAAVDWVTGTFSALWHGALNGISAAWAATTGWISNVFVAFRDFVTGIAQNVWDWVVARFDGLRAAAIAIFTAIRDWLVGIWNGLRDAVVAGAQALWDLVSGIFTRARDGWVRTFTVIRDLLVGIWNGFRDIVVNVAQGLWDLVSGIFNRARDGWIRIFTDTRNNVVAVWTGLRDAVVNGAQNAWDWVTDKFGRMRDGVVSIFTGIRDTVGRVWDGLVDKVKTPIRVVFDFVNNNMVGPVNKILGKFPGNLSIPSLPRLREGGLLRGPGTGTSDSILGVDPRSGMPTAAVSNGEFVVNAKTTAANLPFLRAFNAGRLAIGGLVGQFGVPGYDLGGFVGGVIDKAKDAASTVKDFATDMLAKGARKAAELVLGPIVDRAKGLIPADKLPLNMLAGGLDKLYQAVLGKGDEQDKQQASLAGGTFGSSGKRTPNGVGGLGPVAAAAREYVMRTFGIRNIGGYSYRNIAGTNTLSDHATGHAIDVMIPNYKTPAGISLGNQVASYFVNAAKQWGVKYVIWRDQINSGGGWAPYGHPGGGRSDTLQHRDHDHVSFFRNGGLVPGRGGVDSQLGLLTPGEMVLTPPENNWMARFVDVAERSLGSTEVNGFVNHGTVVYRDEERMLRDQQAASRRVLAELGL